MFEIFAKPRIASLFYLLVLAGSFCWAGDKTESQNALKGLWDPTRYIAIDEVKPGMEAYCLTGYRGTEIEKFGLEVLSVIRNIRPGRDAILVQGTDERFVHTGPVAGCSGSPVYIDGRLAGALAFAWTFSKDPLYGVTPIEEMLRVGRSEGKSRKAKGKGREARYGFDFSKPIDFAEVDKKIADLRFTVCDFPIDNRQSKTGNYLVPLPCPLITSGLPVEVCQQLNASLEPFGLMAVAGIAGGANPGEAEDVQLVPGASLVVPLVTGDIRMEVIGTVTETVDDKVYGFGHSLLGYGPIDLPMATGQVHAVVSTLIRSFKYASSLETVGALTTDESTAVFGRLGAEARMIPLTIKVDYYGGAEKRVYNCQVADNRLLTPLVLGPAVSGACLCLGNLPPDHTIEYKVVIDVEGAESVVFENVSTIRELGEMIKESVGSVALLMNNPYKKVNVKSLDFDVRIVLENIVSHIWSVDLSDSKVKAGGTIDIEVVVESFLTGKKKYSCSFEIPDELAPGKYDMIVSGGYGYIEFLRQAVPYRFVPLNLPTLLEAINNLLSIRRDKLYCLLVLPSGGVVVEKAELPDLPATKVLVLADGKRALRIQPYSHWLEKSLETGTVVIDKKVMRITVEK